MADPASTDPYRDRRRGVTPLHPFGVDVATMGALTKILAAAAAILIVAQAGLLYREYTRPRALPAGPIKPREPTLGPHFAVPTPPEQASASLRRGGNGAAPSVPVPADMTPTLASPHAQPAQPSTAPPAAPTRASGDVWGTGGGDGWKDAAPASSGPVAPPEPSTVAATTPDSAATTQTTPGLRGAARDQSAPAEEPPTSQWPRQSDYDWWKEDPVNGKCEGYFGNGFVDRFELMPPKPSTGEHFTCRHHKAVHASICEATNVLVRPSQIKLSHGGEPLESVGRRPDEIELPVFTQGAFQVMDPSMPPSARPKDLNFPPNRKDKIRNLNLRLAESFQRVASQPERCERWVEEPTLFLIRYEYANLFHTSTDWYNAYLATRVLGYGRLPVVFVDGHCQSPMDDAWDAMFPKVEYVKHLPEKTCFRKMIIVPTGYQAAISTGITPTRNCPAQRHVREFGDMMLRSFGIEPLRSCHDEGGNKITLVRREDYKAHPRHNGKIVTRLGNEREIYTALKSKAQQGIEVVEGTFAHMSFKQQLQAVSRSCVLVGAHGAGMTHVLFMPSDAAVLEIRTPGFRRHHFKAYSLWAGLTYEQWDVQTNRPPAEQVATKALKLYPSQ